MLKQKENTVDKIETKCSNSNDILVDLPKQKSDHKLSVNEKTLMKENI